MPFKASASDCQGNVKNYGILAGCRENLQHPVDRSKTCRQCGNVTDTMEIFCSLKGAARRQPWNSCGSTACSSVPETVPGDQMQVQERMEVQSSFQYFSLFHKINFCLFFLTIFILYLNQARLKVDTCEISSSLKGSAVDHQHQQNPWQTSMPSEIESKCKHKSADGLYTHMSNTKKIQEDVFWSKRHLWDTVREDTCADKGTQVQLLAKLKDFGKDTISPVV